MATNKPPVDLMDSSPLVFGFDAGTMNMVCSRQNDKEIATKSLRNVFLPVDEEGVISGDMSNISHIKSDDGVFIIGDDAYRMANIFGKEVRRPMNMGLISSSDIDSIDVLAMMVKSLVGKSKNGTCVFSVPAPSIDTDNDITYHTGVFKRIFTELGFRAIPFNEAMAVVYNECQDENFTGLAFSFGAGLSNVTLSYKSVQVLSFSVARGGDWIDRSVARAIGTVPNRVTSIKERNTDLSNYKIGNKKERRIREAIVYYYQELIEYSLMHVKKNLELEMDNIDLPEEVPIVVSGGTSLATGFMEFFSGIVEKSSDFPFSIKSIKPASNALTCVAEGCLIKALSEVS